MSCLRHCITQLRILMDALAKAALAPDLTIDKQNSIIRLFGKVARLIMRGEVWIYQARVKAQMLANPARRAKVIAELGGYKGLMRWKSRYLAGAPPPITSFSSMPSPRSVSDRPTSSGREFKLPPLPRASSSRSRCAEPVETPYVPKDPFKAPIIVTVSELLRRSKPAQKVSGETPFASYDSCVAQVQSQTTFPPPTPLPP